MQGLSAGRAEYAKLRHPAATSFRLPVQGERCAVTRPGTELRRARVPGLKLFDRLSQSVDGVSEV